MVDRLPLGGESMKKAVFLAHVKDAARQRGGDLKEYLRMTKELGYDGLECDYTDLEQDPRGFAEMLAEAELQIASVPCWFSFEKGVNPEQIGAVVKNVAAAGGKKILAIPGFLDEQYPDALNNMTEGLKILCREAAEFGIQVSLEDFDNIKSPCATAEGLAWFFERVPELGFNLDTGNFLYAEQDVLEITKAFADRITHIHLKDRRETPVYDGQQPQYSIKGRPMYSCPVGQGDIPIRELLVMAEKAGYNGFCSAEHYAVEDQWDFMVKSARWLNEHM